MIFKPSSLHKLFFTYICPRFYGGAPAAPSNTTSTQTVNQSPWQNPVYQALMLGTADKPGPATSMLNASREQMAQWNAINKLGVTPVAQASLGTWNPNTPGSTSTIVDAVNPNTGRYTPTVNPALWKKDATGQYVSAVSPTPAAVPAVAAPEPVPGAAQGGLMGLRGYASGGELQKAAKAAWGRELTAAELAEWTQYQSNTPYDTVLSRMQGYPEGVQYAAANPQGSADKPTNEAIKKYVQDNINNPQLIADTAAKYGLSNQDLATATGYSIDKVNSFIAGTTGTPPYGLMDTMKKVAYFDPVTGKSTLADFNAIQNTARNLQTPEQFAAATDMYGKSTAGLEAAAGYKPTDASASKADVSNATSQGYGAASAASQGYNATNMTGPSNIGAQKADVATMQGAAGVSASPLTDYQMRGPSDINAPTAATAQMQGPASWLDKGTSQAYMDPYVQNVVNLEKEQANRDYQQQLNQLSAQSVKSGAFGGSRQAIQQSEAARNQLFNLANIEAKGLENAYTQGAQQFNTAQGQQLQAGQANLGASQQANLANQAAQIQAMMANQGMDYNTALQNLQARMGIQNTASSQELQAAMANQQTQQQTQSTNMGAQNQASNAYVQQALQAAQANQGAALTTAQANQVSQNAAAQFAANASNATSQFNAANQNQASQFTSGAQNTANLANQQASNTASNAYTQQQLAANQANQQAGLTANQQGIGALQGVASNASGLTGTGSAANAANLANLGAQGQVAQAEQNLGQSYLDAQSANATNWLNAPTSINAGAVNMLGGQNVQGGTATTTGTSAPAKWARGGLIKNGKVSKGSKK